MSEYVAMLRCPFCRKASTTIQCERFHRSACEVYVTAFHSGGPACRGHLAPKRAAAALTANLIRKYVRNQPAPRSGT